MKPHHGWEGMAERAGCIIATTSKLPPSPFIPFGAPAYWIVLPAFRPLLAWVTHTHTHTHTHTLFIHSGDTLADASQFTLLIF
jgi:hypothetical protein